MTRLSDIPLARSIQARLSRVLASGMIAAFLLMTASPTSHASGCHSQDRPVLKYTPSWENHQRTEPVTPPIIFAPRVLTHSPCGDETPLASNSSNLPAVALLIDNSARTSGDDPEPLITSETPTTSQTPSLRVDRPPRPVRR